MKQEHEASFYTVEVKCPWRVGMYMYDIDKVGWLVVTEFECSPSPGHLRFTYASMEAAMQGKFSILKFISLNF
jgi:hypothetical protein